MSSPYQLKSSRQVYKNKWIDVREDIVVRADGGEQLFGVLTMKPGSTILALTEDRQVFLAREYKYGVARTTLELPSGAIDEGETPLAAAQRELEEEMGYRAGRWIDAGMIDPFTTVVSSPNHLFIALDVYATKPHLDAGEQVVAERVPFVDVFAMVLKGDITHGASCVLLLKAREILRAEGVDL